MSARTLASVDGLITPAGEATLPLPDDALFRGDGVFEVVRLYAGRPFALGEHLDRLESSAAAIELPVDRGAIERELGALLDAADPGDAQLRIVATRAGRRVLVVEDLLSHEPSITLASVTYSPSVILNGVKSLSYGANMHATRLARAQGAGEALLVAPEGVVLEAPTASLFWADEAGRLHTPSLANPILDSITRRRIVAAVDVVEGVYGFDALRHAREAFLASTTREVHPVAAIDGAELPWPGPRTEEAASALRAAIEAELGS